MTLTKKIHDVETGEVIEIELTQAEIDQKLKDEAEYIAKKEAKTAMEAQKAATLEKLGLTADEVAALLG